MKPELRHAFRRLRRQHAPALQQALDRSLGDWLGALGAAGSQSSMGERHIGLFWPLGGEPDLRSCLRLLPAPLALPVAEAQGLCYRPWPVEAQLIRDGCGIPAPPAALPDLLPQQLALLLVPALATDRRGLRLGSGGGWYDRLRSDPAWRAVPALTVLPAACVVERLPQDSWDVPFDGWIDEGGCHWLGPVRI